MNIAERIAKQIMDNADLLFDEVITWEVHSDCNMKLWKSAEEFGVFDEVDAILQAESLREMDEAIANMGKENI